MMQENVIQMYEDFSYLQPLSSSDLFRFGNNCDGGYVISKKIAKACEVLLSFGVGQNIDFEMEIARFNPNMKIFMFDHTVQAPTKQKIALNFLKSVYFLDRRYISSALDFRKKYKKLTKNARHFQNKVTNHPWNSYDLHVKDIIREYGSGSLLIKIDIEGDEYKILPAIIEVIDRCKGIIVEFHHIDYCYEQFEKIVKKILLTHDIEHLHGNNYSDLTAIGLPGVIEISFIRKDLNTDAIPVNQLPNKLLDFPNSSWRTDFRFSWN